tara:strand:+ start:799 stop:1239 length:441 start_codon:yes stop_codon:yes gene_type:complete
VPTYTVKYSNFILSSNQKKRIAEGITQVHKKTTGANTYFAQVIFSDNKKNDHFMGGKFVKDKQLFLHGEIRAGRSNEIKNKLIKGLRSSLVKNSGLSKDQIWVYILDLPPNQMIEYGEILPASGMEKIWYSKLPADLKKKLKKLES